MHPRRHRFRAASTLILTTSCCLTKYHQMPWTSHHTSCISCGSTKNKHYGHGLCKICYQKDWGESNAKRIKQYKQQWYKTSKSLIDYREKSRKQKNGKFGAKLLADPHATCCLCGATYDLTIHHRDHRGHNLPPEKRNNKKSNLEILCRRCHGKLHGSVTGWSRNHKKCRRCGTTKYKHHAHGHCIKCQWKVEKISLSTS